MARIFFTVPAALLMSALLLAAAAGPASTFATDRVAIAAVA